ncbi:MAG: hypothetical protein K2L95_01950 [Alphaproteobacteria bacterium]|nr:hypothetical protein [Alphaproteobacteria bacterium]
MQSAAAGVDTLTGAPDVKDSFYSVTHAVVDNNAGYSTNSVYVENDAFLFGDVYVPDGTHLYVRNSGVVDGTFYLGDGAQITQVIRNESDITYLDIDAGFTVLVTGDAGLEFSDILRVGYFADRVILNNTSITLSHPAAGPSLWRRRGPQIQLVGTVTVRIDDVMANDGAMLLGNVDGDGAVLVQSGALHPMYAAQTYRASGNIYMRVVRETDYRKFLDGDIGVYINEYRAVYPDDPMVTALDGATNMTQLHKLMADCARINPLVLMRPVRRLGLMAMDDVDAPGPSGISVAARPFWVLSGDGDMGGTNVSVRFRRPDMFAIANLYAGTLNYSDYLNDFSGIVFGGNMRAHMDLDTFFVDIAGGVGGGIFDINDVWSGHSVVDEPFGVAAHGRADAGMRFNIGNAAYISPFVGMGIDHAWILDSSDGEMFVRTGSEFGIGYELDGLWYDYGMRAIVDTTGAIMAGVRVGAWSKWDNAGGDLGVMIRHDDIATSWQISATARVGF